MDALIGELLAFLQSIGSTGLYLAMLLEGSSLPFPGIVIVLAYGGLLQLNFWAAVWTAGGMALMYSLASLIPYYVGSRSERLLGKKFQKGMERAAQLFSRYGIWSIALSRPFGIGNYISYLAGMSKVGVANYLILTFLGIFPWCFVMLRIGSYVNGNYARFQTLYEQHSGLIYIGVVLLASAFLLTAFRKQRND